MTNDLPVTCPKECPWCGAEHEIDEETLAIGGYACGSAIVVGEPKEENGFQSNRCRITTLTRELAEAKGKLAEIELEIHAVKDPGVIRANIHRILHPLSQKESTP